MSGEAPNKIIFGEEEDLTSNLPNNAFTCSPGSEVPAFHTKPGTPGWITKKCVPDPFLSIDLSSLGGYRVITKILFDANVSKVKFQFYDNGEVVETDEGDTQQENPVVFKKPIQATKVKIIPLTTTHEDCDDYKITAVVLGKRAAYLEEITNKLKKSAFCSSPNSLTPADNTIPGFSGWTTKKKACDHSYISVNVCDQPGNPQGLFFGQLIFDGNVRNFDLVGLKDGTEVKKIKGSTEQQPFYLQDPPQITEFKIYPTSTNDDVENYILTMMIWVYNPNRQN